MKRLTALFCVLIIIFSLCSCGKKSGNDPENTGNTYAEDFPPPVKYKTENKDYSEEFKDEEGNVIARLEISYPVVSSKDRPDAAEEITQWFEEYKDSEADSIRMNLDSLKERNRKFGIEGVTVTRIAVEPYYQGGYHVSYTIKKQSGTNPDEDDGGLTGCTFSLADGYRLSLKALYKSEAENPREEIKRLIQEEADVSYSVRGNIALSEEQKKILDDLFDDESFCIKENTIYFPYSFKTLSSGARTGFYLCPIDFDYAEDVLITPEEYYEQNYKD